MSTSAPEKTELSLPNTLHPPTPAGTRIAPEWKRVEGARETWQLTAAAHPSYPLYYFVPSHTADGRCLIFHSERSGWVQLYRMDLKTGEAVQLTQGTTRESGWEIWSEVRLRGVLDHLSALNVKTNEVFYFDDDELCGVEVETLEDRCVTRLEGRLAVGQTDFSPDGKQFAFIHSDRAVFKQLTGDFRALKNMKFEVDQEEWRQAVPSVISVVDVKTGECRDVMECPFYVHHLIFVDNETLLINHVQSDKIGMWTLNIRTGETAHLRPRNENGAVCHQVVTQGKIFYETQLPVNGRNTVYLGRYDLETNRYEEFPLVEGEFSHVGRDPEGKWVFFESVQERHVGERHYLGMVKHATDAKRRKVEVLRELEPAEHCRQYGQRGHAHPFLDPSRKWLYYTEFVEGIPQIFRMEVEELANDPEYWWPEEWEMARVCHPSKVC